MTDEKILAEQYPAFTEIKTLYESGYVTQAKSTFENSFRAYFGKLGYIEVLPLPLISDADQSVLFTGASISAVKDLLVTQQYPNNAMGVFLTQECLRTNALKYAFKNDWIPYGQMYFQMVALHTRPGTFKNVLSQALDFTQNAIGVEAERIKIRSASTKPQLNTIHLETPHKVEYDTQGDTYYEWEYGMEGVYGEGLTICIYNGTTGKWFDVGNIVIIYDNAGNEIGVEFGFGYEFFLTALLEVDQPLKFSKIFELFEFELGMPQKYYSTLEAVLRMKIAGAKVGRNGVDNIYRRHLKALQYMAEILGKEFENVVWDMRLFSEFINHSDINLVREYEYLKRYVQRKFDFMQELNQIEFSHTSLQEIIADSRIVSLLKKYGLHDFEVMSIFESLDNI